MTPLQLLSWRLALGDEAGKAPEPCAVEPRGPVLVPLPGRVPATVRRLVAGDDSALFPDLDRPAARLLAALLDESRSGPVPLARAYSLSRAEPQATDRALQALSPLVVPVLMDRSAAVHDHWAEFLRGGRPGSTPGLAAHSLLLCGGSTGAALLLLQLGWRYANSRARMRDGTPGVAKSRQDWRTETAMSRHQVDGALERLYRLDLVVSERSGWGGSSGTTMLRPNYHLAALDVDALLRLAARLKEVSR